MLILSELVLCFSLSKSAVERAIILLTTLLNDRRHNMQHDMTEGCFLIAGSNSNWSEQEKEEILNKAFEKYLQKKRKKKTADATNESVLASHIDQAENNDSSYILSSRDECSDMEILISK